MPTVLTPKLNSRHGGYGSWHVSSATRRLKLKGKSNGRRLREDARCPRNNDSKRIWKTPNALETRNRKASRSSCKNTGTREPSIRWDVVYHFCCSGIMVPHTRTFVGCGDPEETRLHGSHGIYSRHFGAPSGHASQELWKAWSHKVHPSGGPRYDLWYWWIWWGQGVAEPWWHAFEPEFRLFHLWWSAYEERCYDRLHREYLQLTACFRLPTGSGGDGLWCE